MKRYWKKCPFSFHFYLLQFSKENPPRCSWATVPPIAAMLKNFVESSLVCMYLQLNPLTDCGIFDPAPLLCHGSKMAENFERLSSFHVLDSILVEKYRSKRTGINFCFAKVPGPLVNGFLCLGKLRAININCRSPLFKLYQTFFVWKIQSFVLWKKNSGITIISF